MGPRGAGGVGLGSRGHPFVKAVVNRVRPLRVGFDVATRFGGPSRGPSRKVGARHHQGVGGFGGSLGAGGRVSPPPFPGALGSRVLVGEEIPIPVPITPCSIQAICATRRRSPTPMSPTSPVRKRANRSIPGRRTGSKDVRGSGPSRLPGRNSEATGGWLFLTQRARNLLCRARRLCLRPDVRQAGPITRATQCPRLLVRPGPAPSSASTPTGRRLGIRNSPHRAGALGVSPGAGLGLTPKARAPLDPSAACFEPRTPDQPATEPLNSERH